MCVRRQPRKDFKLGTSDSNSLPYLGKDQIPHSPGGPFASNSLLAGHTNSQMPGRGEMFKFQID